MPPARAGRSIVAAGEPCRAGPAGGRCGPPGMPHPAEGCGASSYACLCQAAPHRGPDGSGPCAGAPAIPGRGSSAARAPRCLRGPAARASPQCRGGVHYCDPPQRAPRWLRPAATRRSGTTDAAQGAPKGRVTPTTCKNSGRPPPGPRSGALPGRSQIDHLWVVCPTTGGSGRAQRVHALPARSDCPRIVYPAVTSPAALTTPTYRVAGLSAATCHARKRPAGHG
jgi:hypothetical protein